MLKRLSVFMLVLCLVLSLSACGSAAASAASASAAAAASSETEQAPAAAEDTEPAPEAAEEEASAEEAESAVESAVEEAPQVVITYPLTEEKEELSIYCTACNFMGALSNVQMDWDDFSFVSYLEDLTNVHIDYEAVSFEAYQSQYNIYIAAGDYSDLLINVDSQYTGGATSAYEDGVIVDVTDYLADYAPDYLNLITTDATLDRYAHTSDDRVLRFIATYDEPGVKNGSCVRGDWEEELGIEVNDVDSLHEYLLAAKNQYNCESPMYMTQYAYNIMTAFGIQRYSVTGGSLKFYAIDGTVYTPIDQDAYKTYLETMRDWYAEGLIYKDFATTSFDPHDATSTQMIYDGNIAMWDTQLEGLDDYAANATQEGFVTDPIPELTLDGSVNHFTELEYAITDSDICISTNCENIQLAVEWLNYWYTEEGIRLYNYGVEGDTYDLDDNGEVVLKDFVINNEYGVDISSFLRMYCPYGSFTGVYLRGRLTNYSSDLVKEAADLWSSSNDGAYVMPSGVTLTTEQSEELSAIASDIMTYADTCIPKFILGDMDIETEWDTYIQTIEDMGLQDCVAIEQSAYDAYMAA